MSEEKQKKSSHGDLGWGWQSTSQPKKRKEIHGVSSASLVALKSQLAKKKEEISGVTAGAKTKRSRGSGGSGGSVSKLLERSNPGVADRDRIDRLSTKEDRLSDSREAALERKAALYDRLSSGGHMLVDEETEQRYEVDFLLKKAPHTSIDTSKNAVYTTTGGMLSADMQREQERRAWEENIDQEIAVEKVAHERRELIEQLEKQTQQERTRASIARQEQQNAENRKRERLKAEFLKKKLEAAKAAAAGTKGSRGEEK